MTNTEIRQERTSPHDADVRGGSHPSTAAASHLPTREMLHERLRSYRRAMDNARSDLQYLDAKEAFDDAARKLSEVAAS